LPQPTAAQFFQTVNAFQPSAAIKASVELGVFTAIGAGCGTAEALAARCQASVKGTRVLCDFLVIHQFLTKEGDRYGLAPDAAMEAEPDGTTDTHILDKPYRWESWAAPKGKDGMRDSLFKVMRQGEELSLVTRSSDGQMRFLANMASKMNDSWALGGFLAPSV